MDIRVDEKVAVITGASRGIGFAIAKGLADSGAKVMLVSRKAEGLESAAKEIGANASWCVANAGDAEQAEAAIATTIERYGRIDILVNNAATNPAFGPLMTMDRARALKTVDVNQLGVLSWVQAAHRQFMKDNGGVVLNIASIGGLEPEPGIGWYNVTKAAVIHLTKQLAYELSPGVRVNALAPGLVRTDFAKALWEENEKTVSEHIPMRRIGEPNDIASMAVFLCSDAASWMTGSTVVVDGGALSQPAGGVG
jgi:NAD(P)-dependent dehydrogenase (short-subunit alcohol dehydrogenase family)